MKHLDKKTLDKIAKRYEYRVLNELLQTPQTKKDRQHITNDHRTTWVRFADYVSDRARAAWKARRVVAVFIKAIKDGLKG